MFLIFYEIIVIPFKLSFEVDMPELWYISVNTIFLMDILITFNTAIYKKGNLVIESFFIFKGLK
jgi:hyperpolarization activated cyclic nucleotide-gated potassium channel 2